MAVVKCTIGKTLAECKGDDLTRTPSGCPKGQFSWSWHAVFMVLACSFHGPGMQSNNLVEDNELFLKEIQEAEQRIDAEAETIYLSLEDGRREVDALTTSIPEISELWSHA